MISIKSSADMARALASPIDAELWRLLALVRDRLLEYEGYDLGELAHVIIVKPGDALAAVEAEAGVALTGDPFEYVEHHEAWIEAAIILSDDGFGIALLVADDPATDATLLAALRQHV